MGVPTAQTEYVGLGVDLLYQDLTLGGVSYWDFYGNGDYMPLNANNTWFTHGAKFWTTRQVIRHVRPGAQRIDASANDATIKPLAFINGGLITTIILNDSATSITQNVTISGLPPGDYGVGQTTIGGAYSELGVITVPASGNLTLRSTAQTVMSIYPHTADLAPVATLWAANPTFLDLPASTVTLSSNAIDPELSVVSYNWTLDSFPLGASATISNPNIANPSASGLTVPGNYVFGIHFSDGTNTITKQVTVQVFASNQPPFISALQSRLPVIVTLPVDTTVLQAAAFDIEGDPLTMQFSVISQPPGAAAQLVTLQTAGNTIRESARNMTIPGDYIFRYAVSDASNTVTRDINVTVYPLNNSPVISAVSANPSMVTLPADTSALSGITSDPDGDTITHWWIVQSVPSGANPIFSAQGERLTTVSNLTSPGTYVFTLRAIDRTLFASMNDTVIVNGVLPVNLLDFTVTLASADEADLQWKTANESNSSYFDVQRSTDGSNFSSIGRITAAGNSNILLDYSYADNSLPAAPGNQPLTLYYRIAETDLDGKMILSKIQTVNLIPRGISLSIAPDPAKDMLILKINNITGNATISI